MPPELAEPEALDPVTLAQAKQEWARILKRMREYREWLMVASGGRPHHQSCPIGGLFTGSACNVSGGPCWCGASA